ncbi:FeoB small GTPase domain-containing protein, partial [bacterium]|nr:FeoB small GTPase domain-containing protein [bacterium]
MPTDRVFPLSGPLPRPGPTPRVALVGQARSGKSRIFRAASSTSIQHQRLAGVGQAYEECLVEVDHKQISLVDLPPISSLHHLHGDTSSVLKYLLWGDRWPQIIGEAADAQPSHASFAAPDVLLLVMDATSLERDLELALELAQIGKPMVVALNRMDEARNKRLYINIDQLESNLGAVVIPTVAHMGMGLDALFAAVIDSARQRRAPKPQPPSTFISSQLTAIADIVAQTEVAAAFSTPSTFLVMQLAENNDDFYSGLRRRFPDQANAVLTARTAADASLPRPLAEEIHADRHHRAALMFEDVTRPGGGEKMPRWHRWTDELFLHPRLGFVGVMATLALVLFVVFEVSAFLDSITV